MNENPLEDKARKIWINTSNIRNIPFFADLHKGSISRWLRRIRKANHNSTIIDLMDVCKHMNFPLEKTIALFENGRH
jgi:hypothetical protein